MYPLLCSKASHLCLEAGIPGEDWKHIKHSVMAFLEDLMHFTALGSLKHNVPCRLSRSQHVLPVLQYEPTDAGVLVTCCVCGVVTGCSSTMKILPESFITGIGCWDSGEVLPCATEQQVLQLSSLHSVYLRN